MSKWIELDAGLGFVRADQIVRIQRITDRPDLCAVRLADGIWAQVRMAPKDLMAKLDQAKTPAG